MEDRGTLGVLIGGKHTLRDWNLGWLSITLGFPEAKTYEQDIPGADGSLDLTEAMTPGDVKYKQRSLTMEFDQLDKDYFDWNSKVSEIANYLVGQKFKIFLDSDPAFYYIGRLKLDSEKSEKAESRSHCQARLTHISMKNIAVWKTGPGTTSILKQGL